MKTQIEIKPILKSCLIGDVTINYLNNIFAKYNIKVNTIIDYGQRQDIFLKGGEIITIKNGKVV